MLNCSNNTATDIDICHLICIILHTNRNRRRPHPCWNKKKTYWQDLGFGQTTETGLGRDRVRVRVRVKKETPSRLSCNTIGAPFSAVCLCFCKFIDNWQFEMATTAPGQTQGLLSTFDTSENKPSPYTLLTLAHLKSERAKDLRIQDPLKTLARVKGALQKSCKKRYETQGRRKENNENNNTKRVFAQ